MKLARKAPKKPEEKKKKEQSRETDLAPSYKKFSDYKYSFEC
jgi:hypothetical protein